jgi:hypothetical protein
MADTARDPFGFGRTLSEELSRELAQTKAQLRGLLEDKT